MKIIATLLVAALAFAAGYANAATTFDFTAVSGGYVTNDPSHTVEAVNIANYDLYGNKTVTISVDMVWYKVSPGVADLGAPNLATATDGSGRTITVSVLYTTTRTCTHSGRAQHCTTYYAADSGTVQ